MVPVLSVAWILRFPKSRSICCVACSTWRGVSSVSQQTTALMKLFSDSKPQGSVETREDWRTTSPTLSPISLIALRI